MTGSEHGAEAGGAPDQTRQVVQSREQHHLHSALRSYGEELGAMYLGGLRVLRDTANPDRMAQSALSMRELMVKMGELDPANAGENQSTGSMKQEVFQLKEGFVQLKRNTKSYSEAGVWTGPFNGHLRRFLKKLDNFFAWVKANSPSRREQFQRTMVRLDPSDRALPKPLLDTRYREWQELLNFFQGTLHHGLSPSRDEVRKRIGELEALLADLLVPTTFDDLNAIDALLQESDDA